MKKKLLVSIIAIIITVCSLAMLVSCDRPSDGADAGDGDVSLLSYELLEVPLRMAVMGLGSYEGNHLVIPREYNGWNVEEISSANYGILDGSMVSGNSIMPQSTGSGPIIQKVSMHETVKRITKYALCSTNIEEIVIGSKVEEISNHAFYGCSRLKKISVDPSNEHFTSIDGVLYSKDGSTLIKYPNGKTDKEFRVPSTTLYINPYAFETNQYLEKIIISDSVTDVRKSAFADCTNLKTVEFGSGIVSIRESVFFGCKNLTSVTIPSSVLTIEAYAFPQESNLSSVVFEQAVVWGGVSSIGDDYVIFEESEVVDSAEMANKIKTTYYSYLLYKGIVN